MHFPCICMCYDGEQSSLNTAKNQEPLAASKLRAAPVSTRVVGTLLDSHEPRSAL